MAKYSASEAAKAVNQLLQFSEQDHKSMLEVISDFFDLSLQALRSQNLENLHQDHPAAAQIPATRCIAFKINKRTLNSSYF